MTLGRFHSLPSAMRFALTLSAIFAVSAVVAGAVAWALVADDLRARLLSDVEAEAEALAHELELIGPELFAQHIENSSGVLARQSLFVLFAPSDGAEPVGSIRVSKLSLGPRSLRAGRDFTLPGEATPADGMTFLSFGTRTRHGWIVVARDRTWITESREVLLQSMGWGLGIALMATVLLAIAIGRRDASRVAELKAVLDAVARGDLSARTGSDSGYSDDIAQVGQGLNTMLARLQTNVDRMKQVSADIAHDLRAPLTRLRLALEPEAMRDDLPADTRTAIGNTLEGLTEVSGTFDAILQLARLETGRSSIPVEPCDPAEIAGNVVSMLEPVAEETGHRLEFVAPGDGLAPAELNASLMTQALVNLVENALRHTPEGTLIEVRATSLKGAVTFTVCDDGPGIPEAELGKVAQRFYRLDKSRTDRGTGLGLSLVKAIAERHGGRLELTDNKPGLCARIVLQEAPR